MTDVKNTRREPRENRLVRVHFSSRTGEGVSAEVLDASRSGLFIVPSASVIESVGSGDKVWIVVSTVNGEQTFTGKVRWRGYSQAHNAIGVGVELDESQGESMISAFKLRVCP